MMIEVHAVPTPPRVLRWEPWTAGAIIEYQVRWLPTSAPTPGAGAAMSGCRKPYAAASSSPSRANASALHRSTTRPARRHT